jgi:hypothetical protein
MLGYLHSEFYLLTLRTRDAFFRAFFNVLSNFRRMKFYRFGAFIWAYLS